MKSEAVLLERHGNDGPVVSIRLNRPERRNALNESIFHRLNEIATALTNDQSARVVVLSGVGDTFCAGFDLDSALEDPGLMRRYIELLSETVRRYRRLPQIVVASVQGAAIAGGCALLGGADFVIATKDARFGYPVHRIGVSPVVSLPSLRASIGDGEARSLLLGGHLISAAEAKSIGLVWRLAGDADTLRSETDDLAVALLEKGPRALRVTKRWLNELDGSATDTAFAATAQASAALCEGHEAIEYLRAVWGRDRKS
ncbi:MAG: enoyl-CoA hydratase/isomerase family protein [Phycisphaerales bacterium]